MHSSFCPLHACFAMMVNSMIWIVVPGTCFR